jgi:hypothetical protein
MANETGEKKIIVDEDWKAQVQAEKEAQQRAAQQQPSDQTGTAAGPRIAGEEEALPPPTLAEHILSLASQALMLMGQVPNPQTGKAEVHLPYARHVIDTIAMLEEKTRGNRTAEEISLLSRVLHELRMNFVAAQSQAGTGGTSAGA